MASSKTGRVRKRHMRHSMYEHPLERWVSHPPAPPEGQGLTLPLAMALADRRRRQVDIVKAHQSNIEYEAGVRKAAELATLRGERDRIRGMLTRPAFRTTVALQARMQELERVLG